jgi:magnesium chelatase family protein
MREQVQRARRMQAERFRDLTVRTNAQMTTRQIRKFCPLDKRCAQLLKDSVHELGLSARAHDKVMRVSRTIADLSGAEQIGPEHIQEAVNYRMLDRQLWT